MAKKSTVKKTPINEDDLEKIDIFYFPKSYAAMYRVLREAVADDILAAWQEKFGSAERVSDNPEEGEAIVAYVGQEEVLRYYLNPTNISHAQVARDKDQMATYLEQYEDKFR